MNKYSSKKKYSGVKEWEHLKYNSKNKYEKAFKHLDYSNRKKKQFKITNLDKYMNKEKNIKINNLKIFFKNKIENINTNSSNKYSFNLINEDINKNKLKNKKLIKKSYCNCNKNNCLKNYCSCFKNGNICSNTCQCIKCKNILSKERQIIYKIKKIDKEFLRLKKRLFYEDKSTNCACTKGCLKNYCSCIKNKNFCDINCSCLDCFNLIN